jgi:hypothetical protein
VVVRQRPQAITGGEKVSPKVASTHGQPSSGGSKKSHSKTSNGGAVTAPATTPVTGGVTIPTGPANNNVAPPPQLAAGQAGALAAELASSAASVQALSFYRIPLFLLPIYQAAAQQYGVPWQILAAINEIETNYGTDQSVSTAGAVGWMQFMPATWASYGVDAFKAGYADPYNPVDAIFAAARYLRAAGAAQDLKGAILAYNHSDEYAESVLLRAKLISTYPQSVIATLTGLVNDRPPATGHPLGWGAVHSSESPAKTASTAPATHTVAKPAGTPGSEAPPAPAAAAAAATGTASPAGTLKLIDLLSDPHAAVVAVQDGRILKLGSSHRLGNYVILRDLYGDVFTYAGLGSIASSYRLQTPPHPPLKIPAAVDTGTQDPAPSKPASAGRQLPMTLKAQAPTGEQQNIQALLGAGASEPTPTGMGKVRLFAHPHNPDALAAADSRAASAREAARREGAGASVPLRSGSLVAEGTVLGHVSHPPGASDGHLQFAIRPAGDPFTIDPQPILSNWVQLAAALHPQGAKTAQSLSGATAGEAFVLSKSRLRSQILSDPGISMSACSKSAIASGQIDKRALAVLSFLSRSGLKPTVGTLACGAGQFAVAGYVPPNHEGYAIAITKINGIAVAGNQGSGSVTDTTIRTLLTLPGRFAPQQIVSLMRYPGHASTLARSDHGRYIEIVFSKPKPASAAKGASADTAAQHSAPTGQGAPSPEVPGELSAVQWEQLIARLGALPVPNVSTKPSSSAIPDPAAG